MSENMHNSDNDNEDYGQKLLEEAIEIFNKIVLLANDAQFNLDQVLKFVDRKKGVKRNNITEEERKEIYREAKIYLGRLVISAREQRKTDAQYDALREKVNKYYGENILRSYPRGPYIDDEVKKILEDRSLDWWKE